MFWICILHGVIVNGALVEAGAATFSNCQDMFSSRLGDVKTKADSLKNNVDITKIYLEQWNPRFIDTYKSSDSTAFDVVGAANIQGTLTSYSNDGAIRVCYGYSTQQADYTPFFYIECGDNKYVGPNPYNFSPDFTDKVFARWTADLISVRSFACISEVYIQ